MIIEHTRKDSVIKAMFLDDEFGKKVYDNPHLYDWFISLDKKR